MNTDIRAMVWYDFLNYKHGGEYLTLYIKREGLLKNRMQIAGIVFSAGGLCTLFSQYTIPTAILLFLTALIQLAQLLDTHIFHSEKDKDKLKRLRLMYITHTNKLEKLFKSFETKNKEEFSFEFFSLRENSEEMEKLDDEVIITTYKRLVRRADKCVRDYIKIYYNE